MVFEDNKLEEVWMDSKRKYKCKFNYFYSLLFFVCLCKINIKNRWSKSYNKCEIV